MQKNAIFQDIRDTLHNLLVAVSGSCAVGERAPSEGASGVDEMNEDVEREALFDFDEDNMATQMEKVQHQLSGIQRYSLDEDFNLYIDAIIRNSMAVAQVSKEALRNIITGLCHQVSECTCMRARVCVLCIVCVCACACVCACVCVCVFVYLC